ncbi:DNA mismatch repair endonuclease MutL [Pelagibacterium xiamenense]|uniref:DNA mismatch repair endonuclease MutL n=1 Tax=Pelagibacterium xiamenense TaxID=2901140 RepID=UPI001E47A867|nr:DNA mismatch repair endonuclease MutL [Pelagibacterium xiamenense]MCD7059219.1 DNA mismatch repair endonuclease MutL [Pelagibacterium xiamenense]
MAIRQLPDDLVNKIAAGEVVERPASVVKELVENALDAGARRIAITTGAGGKGLIRIEDDGHGMDETDLLLSVERHATSKLSDGGLDDIRTLGFRGEALASIGAVSDLSIASRPANAQSGLKLTLKRGLREGPVPQAMNRGTIVEVKNLFAAVPARLKFLKTDRAEANAITDVVKRLAMAHRGVHFVLSGSDRSATNWPAQTGENAVHARLAQIIGTDFPKNAQEIAFSRGGIVVGGLAGLPTYSRANTLNQFYFVNGRSVRDKVLLGAVRAAYADFLHRDRFPVLALFVAIDPADVDVNVHPTKAELRFRDPGAVRGTVIRALTEALGAAGFRASSSVADNALASFRVPEAPAQPAGPGQAAFAEPAATSSTPAPGWTPAERPNFSAEVAAHHRRFDAPSARMEPLAETVPDTDYPLGVARAQVFENYIVAQNGDALVLIDQHAAHERLVYERFRNQLRAGPVPSQAQLIPVVVDLPEEDCGRLEDARSVLERLGLYLERFGPSAIAVNETPALLGQADVEGLIRDLADGLAEWDSVAVVEERMDAIIARMACHGSVRSGRRLRGDEMNALLREMEATPHSGQCIHGRPTYIELKKGDLERLFGRR